MPVKIFIAAPWEQKHIAEETSEKLQLMGCGVTSRWHRANYKASSREVAAVEDLEDIDSSQVLLLLDIEPSKGKHHEAGYAQGKGIPIIWWHNTPLDFLDTESAPIYALHPDIINIWSWDGLFIEMLKMDYPSLTL